MITPGYLLNNAYLRHISQSFHNHYPISMILSLITQASRRQAGKPIWIKIRMNSYSSWKIRLKPTGMIMVRRWRSSQINSQKWSHHWWIRLKFRKYSPDIKNSPKAQDPTTVVSANNKDPTFGRWTFYKKSVMWNLKN